MKAFLRNKDLPGILIILYFVVYLSAGVFIFSDYGVSVDETVQRNHSLVTYKYVNEKLFNREIPELEKTQALTEYEHKYYGVALQMPLVVIEDIFNFKLTTRQIYLMRHLYNFLICVTGYICFYICLKKIFTNKWLALFGTILISLYPRFFAYQFYDIKNLIFASLNMITLLALVNVVEKCSFRNILLFALVASVTTNQRIMGVLFPVILVGYFIVTDIMKLNSCSKDMLIKKYVMTIGLYFLGWFIVTPLAWEEPVRTFYEVFIQFSHYEAWDLTMMFCGRMITCDERPWYYLFVWFGISIPLIYIILFITGHVYALVSLFKSKDKWNDILVKNKWLTCSLAIFWGSVGAVIIMNSRIYEEWRHMFFVFVPFCVVAVYGFKYLLLSLNKKVVIGIVTVCLSLQFIWMIANHPRQYVYFNLIGQQFASNFDRDSWRVANYEMLRWILENDEDEQIEISMRNFNIARLLLDKEEKNRFESTKENPEYIVENYKDIPGNVMEYDGYEEVYTIWVDKFKIGSVYRRLGT